MAFSKKRKLNIGVLGHIDSGKTTLCQSLSTILSTGALDKNPQAQERGITLDLQFSAIETPNYLLTLTDCPGHASLIRTIIGGAQIIDFCLMVIDATKGIQTQTAEGLIIASVTVKVIVVVLNKVDLLPKGPAGEKRLQKLKKAIEKAFSLPQFEYVKVVTFSAKESSLSRPSPSDPTTSFSSLSPPALELVEELEAAAAAVLVGSGGEELEAPSPSKLLFLVDHCFPIKGKGKVATGKVVRGSLSVGQIVQIPQLGIERKVKSIQMFRKNVELAQRGDRVGALLTQFDDSLLERGLICSPNSVALLSQVLVTVSAISFFKWKISPSFKYHVSIGHYTVMASFSFFSPSTSDTLVKELEDESSNTATNFQLAEDYENIGDQLKENYALAVMTLATPIYAPLHSLYIASKLDIDVDSKDCRLAFHGKLVRALSPAEAQLKLFTRKNLEGIVDRVTSKRELIAANLFAKGADVNLFVGLQVTLENGDAGTIASAFGKSGKFKVTFTKDFSEPAPAKSTKVMLAYKKFPKKKGVQAAKKLQQ
eukprot:TRINITY_DN10538_c0_g1_i1.p1 TRINITY_DN10538_c0_g1~~TRINITY_DN10538_c0_g1_i1.p1  ORF type:complete len:539 (-),score=129.03 TRINITY_DN10538_c0_g1_i1:240-1856(-)